jgi:adenosylcobyric acid synthase
VISEGAGSPVELNLMDKDLSNIFIATEYNTKIILVADIEKGGVFASIYGVYHLLPPKLQKNVIGVVINKFRGEMKLFDEGVRIIEEDFGIPVLGVLPYEPFNLGFEDSASLQNFVQDVRQAKIHVGVIAYPTMSNYNDIEPLVADEELNVQFISHSMALDIFDVLILPGSKLVIKDLQWLKNTGLFDSIQVFTKPIMAICGGYEMMFKSLHDKYAIENNKAIVEKGFGVIDDEVVFEKEKVLKKATYELFGFTLKGFEIHHGNSKKYPLFTEKKDFKGTFVHGVFDDDSFRTAYFKQICSSYEGYSFQQYKEQRIQHFVQKMKHHINADKIIKEVQNDLQ